MGTFIGIIITIIFTWFFAWYYFKKSQNIKNLTPFLEDISEIFSDIDQDLKDDLKIKYKNRIIDNFYRLQYLVINTGNTTIKDCKTPLKLKIPNGGEVLEAKILMVNKDGRSVKVLNKKKYVEFLFKLLNKGEYFITRILVKGELNLDFNRRYETIKDMLEFEIESDGLPPIIKSIYAPPKKPVPKIVIISQLFIRYLAYAIVTGIVIFLLVHNFTDWIDMAKHSAIFPYPERLNRQFLSLLGFFLFFVITDFFSRRSSLDIRDKYKVPKDLYIKK